jgi:competence protein ComEC
MFSPYCVGGIHVLVVSGLHVGYVAAVFWLLFRFLPLPNLWRKLSIIPVLIVYAMVTGAAPPVIRATIMAVALIICYLLGRERSIYHAFALAAFVILLINPQALFTASFQLSFAACLGIVYMRSRNLSCLLGGQSARGQSNI